MPYISSHLSEGTPDLLVVEIRAYAIQKIPSLTLHIEPIIGESWKPDRVRDVKILIIPCHEDDATPVGFRIEG